MADGYGESFENRIKLLVEVIMGTRSEIPVEMPLLLRVSATKQGKEDLETSRAQSN